MSKWMWIIAGPNGAGKSSFAGDFLDDLGYRNLIRLNADDRTKELRNQFTDAQQYDLNLLAAQEIDQSVINCINEGHSFVVETVLSSQKYRDDVLTAKEKGFHIGIIYISLYPPELSPQRVSERVKKGGHNVDYQKTLERHQKSHKELSWFAPKADSLLVFDNSNKDANPVLVASRFQGRPLKYFAPGFNPSLDNALKNMLPKPRNNGPAPTR